MNAEKQKREERWGGRKVTITVESNVDPEWLDYVLCWPDIFSTDYIGYWAHGFRPEGGKEKGVWLVLELGDSDKHPTENQYKQVEACWKEGRPLPKHWYVLDEAAAIRAWAEGVKKFNDPDWYDRADHDANDYDVIIQRALLGEVRYG